MKPTGTKTVALLCQHCRTAQGIPAAELTIHHDSSGGFLVFRCFKCKRWNDHSVTDRQERLITEE